MTDERRVLVIGYGNPGRRDDGLGPALSARLDALELPGVTVQTTYQLNVEDAQAVADSQVAVFVDACLRSPPPFFLRELEPRSGTMEFTTHTLAPEGVLGLAHDVLGARTRGFALAVRGYDLHSFEEGITDEAGINLEAALSFLARSLEPGGRLNHQLDVTGVGI